MTSPTAAVGVSATRTRIDLVPAATGMVWLGEGRAMEPMAVPGVALGAGDVLVEVELATICGSDLHTVQGHRTTPTPTVLGHESVGRIVATAPGALLDATRASLDVGDRVVWSVAASCGVCDRCDRGLAQKCRALRKYGHERVETGWELNGALASHVHVLAGTPLVRVDEGIPAEAIAPVSCGTATAAAALRAASDVVDLEGAVVLVSGAGLIGLTAAAMATDAGAQVFVVDPDAARRAAATDFGAVAAFDPTAHGGVGLALHELGVEAPDVVLEASGAPRAVASGLDLVAVGGVVVLVGSVFPTAPVPVVPERIVRGLVTVRGVHNYAARDLVTAAAFVRDRAGAWPLTTLVGRTFPLAELDAALACAAEGASIRVAVTPPTHRTDVLPA